MKLRVIFRIVFCAALAVAAYAAAADQQPGPVVYQPDFVGEGRIFMVALSVPTGAPDLQVDCPPTVKLLDRTRLPAKSDVRRYYFRALKPAKAADIVFSWPGQRLTVSLGIWSFEDLRQYRTLNGTQLPRRWPLGEALPELKTSQTLPRTERHRARYQKSEAEQWLALGDDAIWGMQPDSTIPRWHWVNLKEGCPIHGTDVYKEVAFYPWLNDKGVPLQQ
jgi:hypothetical protein